VSPAAPAAAVVALLLDMDVRGSSGTERAQLERELRNQLHAPALLDQRLGLFAADALANAERTVDAWRRERIEVLTPADAGRYPRRLRDVDDGPAVLFARGELDTLNTPGVAIVGTRGPSPEGVADARRVAEQAVRAGYAVVSGLALGIDAAAHAAAIDHGGATIAVLGSGLRRGYPRENAALVDRIERAGAVISQWLPDAEPNAERLRARNSVIAALSDAMIVVEASERSGARIAVRHALRYGRRVVLLSRLMRMDWARELAATDRVQVIDTAQEAIGAFG
jgi:DNA processing protein